MRLSSLYLRNLGPIVFGFAIVGLLNLVTPLESLRIRTAFLFFEGRWVILPCIIVSILIIVGFLQFLIQYPISESVKEYRVRGIIQKHLQNKAGRRLLNLPFLLGFVHLAVWIFIPAFMFAYLLFFTNMTLKDLFVLFRSIIVGMISSTISFFLIEGFSRDRLIPLFFPQGRLSALPGTIDIPIGRRISLLFVTGTIVPMIILVGTLFFTLWGIEDTTTSARTIGRDILIFAIILCVIYTIIGFRLNILVGNSILKPIDQMLEIMRNVSHGNFSKRIRVVTNDELGILGDTGNEMMAGLLERDEIRDTFGKYVTPEIRDLILAGQIPLKGTKVEATLLFSDLRDFTHYVEENDPEEVIQSMNSYFTAMEETIRKHQGLVLQYVGDEIEAVFGVLPPGVDHADRAVAAAHDMRKRLEVLNRSRIKAGKVPFRHGIGIHTGEVLAGNIGSQNRLSYALIGSTVNLASRVEQLTKEIGCDILASEETFNKLSNSYSFKQYLSQSVQGYSKPITVYSAIR